MMLVTCHNPQEPTEIIYLIDLIIKGLLSKEFIYTLALFENYLHLSPWLQSLNFP